MVMRNLVLQVFSCLNLIWTGNLSLEKSQRKKPCDWLPEQGWEDLVKLAELFPEVFSSLPDDVGKNASEWRTVSHNSGRNHRNSRLPYRLRVFPWSFVASVVRPGRTRASFVPHEVCRHPVSLSAAAAAALLPRGSGLQSCDRLHNCYHGWEVSRSVKLEI